MSEFIKIAEMAPRDGLQNEKRIISTADKVHLVDLLSKSGLSHIEVTSFVSPKWVPQMADASEVLTQIKRQPNVIYSALTPNKHGYDMANSAGADEIAVFASASEAFSQQNINCSIKESYSRFLPIISASIRDKCKVRAYVSCVVGCPYEGEIAPSAVADVVTTLLDLGCYEVSLGDTIGVGTPDTISRMLDTVVAQVAPNKVAGHYHDTNNRALDNIRVSLDFGVRTFDASVGGLGGCPYALGAKGNVDTVAVAELLADLGYVTGVDVSSLKVAANFAKQLVEG